MNSIYTTICRPCVCWRCNTNPRGK